MELKEAYIDEIICHHFSMDPSKSLVNNSLMDLKELDNVTLKDFFVKPFVNVKTEFGFSHPVNLSYNVVYQTVLKIIRDDDFVGCSQDIFKHLQSVSILPTIKDGDLFIAKVSDIMSGDTYYDGLGIFKIERKSEFIETFIDKKGHMQFTIKNGFSMNRIDKACLIVFTEKRPKCLIIDTSKDTKFWRQDFLGLVPMPNAFSQSKAAIQVFQSFISEELKEESILMKNERIELMNRWAESIKYAEKIQMEQIADSIIQDDGLREKFSEYCKLYEAKEGIQFAGELNVDKRAVSVPKKLRTIRLDDTVEINLMKTGGFIERGYDENRGMNYYKLYFSKEK